MHIAKSTGDGFAFALSAGEAIGRVGCFFNGCCYGAATAVPWAVCQAGALRHPAQIYSSLFALSIFLVLLYLQNKVKYEGDLFRIYLLMFAAGRFVMEFFRERGALFFGFSIAQWISLEISLSMLAALAWCYFLHKPEDRQAAEASAHESM